MTIQQFMASALILGFNRKINNHRAIFEYVLKDQSFISQHGYIIYNKARIHRNNKEGLSRLFSNIVERTTND